MDAAVPDATPDVGLGPGSDEQREFLRQGTEKLAAGDIPGAIVAFTDAREGKTSGASVSAGIALGDLLERANKATAAKAVYTALLAETPKLPEVQFVAARFFAGQGEDQSAIAGFSKVVELQPDFLPAYPPLAALLARSGRAEEAGRRLVTYESRLGVQLRAVKNEGAKTEARIQVVHLLATLEDERVQTTMLQLLESPDKQLRIAAASVIADGPSPAGIEALRVAVAAEAEPFTQRALKEALRRAIASSTGPAPK